MKKMISNAMFLGFILFLCLCGLLIGLRSFNYESNPFYNSSPSYDASLYEEYSAPKMEAPITRKIQEVFLNEHKKVKVSQLTNFVWDNACIFERPDASSNSSANVYAHEYIRDNNIEGKMKISREAKRAITLIVFFNEKKTVYTYYNDDESIPIGQRSVFIHAQSSNTKLPVCGNPDNTVFELRGDKSYPVLFFKTAEDAH